jgi:hypothetical protein
VLGVLRLDWADVASIVGVAVTPVVGYVGDLSKEQLRPNPDEVSHCFTIPLKQVRYKPFTLATRKICVPCGRRCLQQTVLRCSNR